jgi:hypothetical protein
VRVVEFPWIRNEISRMRTKKEEEEDEEKTVEEEYELSRKNLRFHRELNLGLSESKSS